MSLIASASASPVGLSVHRLPREVTASLESNSFTSAVISTDNQGRGVLVVDDPAHSRRPDLGFRSHVDDLRQRAHAIAGRPRLLKPEASTSVDWTYCRRNQSVFSEDLFGDDRFRQDQRQYSDAFYKQAQRQRARDRARDGILAAEALGRDRERQVAAFARGTQSLTRVPAARNGAVYTDQSSHACGFAHALERLHRFYGEDLFQPFRPGYYYRRMPTLTKTFDDGVRTEWRMTEGIPFVPFALDSRPRFILDATGSLWQQADTRPKVAGSRRVTIPEDAAGDTGQLCKNRHAEEPSRVLTLSSTPPPEDPYLSRAAQWSTRGESPADSLSKLSESRWRSFVDLAR